MYLLILGESRVVVCPVCHVICSGNNIIENHFLVEGCPTAVSETDTADVSKFNELKCGSCPETAATSWCVECAEYICEGCVQVHFKDRFYFSIRSYCQSMFNSIILPSTDVTLSMCYFEFLKFQSILTIQ